MLMTATYSPEDNKLRLYCSSRLDADTHTEVKAAGFKWAPKQDLFVAPMWTPAREDLLLSLCGEIGDEDTSLVARAEARAERFEDYSEKRAREAENSRKAVGYLANGIPLGQPILVGHHSEKRARKDAARIENGMRKAVNLWETAQYWESRAAGAVRAAKYKERPDVRARRIKTLEADKRKQERNRAGAERWLALWTKPGLTLEQGRALANVCWLNVLRNEQHPYGLTAYDVLREEASNPWTLEQVQEVARRGYSQTIAHCERWLDHYTNRIAYERAMLAEQGKSELLEKKPRPKQLPLCNYRAPEGLEIENIYHRHEMIHYPQIEMTQAEYAKIGTDYKGTRTVDNSHRVRTAMRGHSLCCVFLTDSKVHARPEAVAPAPKEMPAALTRALDAEDKPKAKPEVNEFDAMKKALKAGPVQIVAAPQLFPTPPDIAAQMVDRAEISPDHRVLEPSAGTGNLLKAIGDQPDKVAVEINTALANGLTLLGMPGLSTRNADFLECNGDLGTFDRIVMNPPFGHGADIKHIKHALHMLRPGGVLVALCTNGPRQEKELQPLADTWEKLPEGSFKAQGTGVNVVMLTIRQEA